jgi:hypothetical protein
MSNSSAAFVPTALGSKYMQQLDCFAFREAPLAFDWVDE